MHHNKHPRILIARMSAVGDTILTLPVACALRDRFPHAHLGWVVEQKASWIVRDHPCLDEVIVLPRGWFTSLRGIRAARRQLLPGKFEIAIDCQSVTKSALACWLSGAKRRIGCRGKYGCELSPLFNNERIQPQTRHLVDRSRELLQPLGIEKPHVQWQYPLDTQAIRRTAALATDLKLGARFAVINPGASWDSKLWVMTRFGQVAAYLGATYGLRSLVVWGGAREQAWANEIVAASEGWAIPAPPTDLAELAAFLHQASLFVGSDTGPLHLSVAVGTPTIGLHGVTWPEESGPYGPPHLALLAEYEGGSRRQRRATDNRAMRLISTEMVQQACDRLLQTPAVDAA